MMLSRQQVNHEAIAQEVAAFGDGLRKEVISELEPVAASVQMMVDSYREQRTKASSSEVAEMMEAQLQESPGDHLFVQSDSRAKPQLVQGESHGQRASQASECA